MVLRAPPADPMESGTGLSVVALADAGTGSGHIAGQACIVAAQSQLPTAETSCVASAEFAAARVIRRSGGSGS